MLTFKVWEGREETKLCLITIFGSAHEHPHFKSPLNQIEWIIVYCILGLRSTLWFIAPIKNLFNKNTKITIGENAVFHQKYVYFHKQCLIIATKESNFLKIDCNNYFPGVRKQKTSQDKQEVRREHGAPTSQIILAGVTEKCLNVGMCTADLSLTFLL